VGPLPPSKPIEGKNSFIECGMRSYVVGIVLLAALGGLLGDPQDDPVAERVARLIKQLGHHNFAKREEAGKELDAIGEPALDALRKAASAEDAEVRRRAERIVQGITGRLRAAAARKELAKWEGSWEGDPAVKMTIKGDRFTSSAPGVGARNGTITFVEVGEKMTQVDMLVEEGDTKGQTFKAIFRLDGDTLHSCGTYDGPRPVEFKSGGANYHIPWKRAKR
jgi:uncharacterized protein (TIGR03067 family)